MVPEEVLLQAPVALLAVQEVDRDCGGVGDVAALWSVLVSVCRRRWALGLTRRCLARSVEATWLIGSTRLTSRRVLQGTFERG